MTKSILFWTLFALSITACLASPRARRAINWNGNNWAKSCDFKGNDLSNVRVAAELCGGKCESTQGCTHFTWTQYNGGTCWMKKGTVSKNNAVSTNDQNMVCGVRSGNSGGNQESSKSKRGIAWPSENKQDSPKRLSGGEISWVYNWSPYKTDITGAEYVPMLWSANRGHDGSQFINQVKDAKVVLGFNEPERVDQARMSVREAVNAWKQFIEPLRAQGVRLGSPSIASTNDGLNWLDEFVKELNNASGHIDFICLHWYGQGADNFINWITTVRQRLGNKYPVWVTEFACTSWNPTQQASQREVNEFMQQSIIKLDALDWVERYAWFGAQRSLDAAVGPAIALFAPNGELSDLGQKYVHGFKTIFAS